MNFKSTALLFGVLLGIMWLFGLMLAYKRITLEEDFVMPKLRAKEVDIDRVVLMPGGDRAGDKLTFTLHGEQWLMEVGQQGKKVRANSGEIRSLLEEVRDARKSEETDIANDLAGTGLDNPTLTVTLSGKVKGKDQEEWTLYLGKESADNEFVCVKSSDRPGEVMAVRRPTIKSLFYENRNHFRDSSFIAVDPQSALRLALTRPKEKDPKTGMLILKKKEKDTPSGLQRKEITWWFESPANYGLAASEGFIEEKADEPGTKAENSVPGLLSAIDRLRVPGPDDFEAVGAKPLAAYGLADGKETLRIEVERLERRGGFPGEEDKKEKRKTIRQVILIGDKAPVRGKDKDKEQGAEQYYARLLDERLPDDVGVGRVNAKDLKALFEAVDNSASLRSRDLSVLDPQAPVAVSLKYRKEDGQEEEIWLFQPETQSWRVNSGSIKYAANPDTIHRSDGLLQVLQGKGKVKTFKDAEDDKDLGLDKPVATVRVWVDGLVPRDKKDAKDKKDGQKKDGKDEKKEDQAKKDSKGDKKDDQAKKDGKGDKKDDQAKKDGKDEKKDSELEYTLRPDAKPALTLQFALTADEVVYVKREMEDWTSRVSVPKAILDKIRTPEGALTYLATPTPNSKLFDYNTVVKIELTRGDPKEEFVLERDDSKDKGKDKGKAAPESTDELAQWKLLKPESFKERTHADAKNADKVLDDLLDTHRKFKKWVARATPKTLEQYQLEKPQVIATLTLKSEKDKDKTETIVFKFGKVEPKEKSTDKKDDKGKEKGKDTDKDKEKPAVKEGVYVMQSSGDLKDLIFLADEEIIKSLREIELRDRTVVKFDPKEVTQISMEIRRKDVDLRSPVLKREGADKWVAVADLSKEFALDSKKVETLVRALSELKTERYLSFKGAPKDEYKLDEKSKEKKPILKIEVTVGEGDKQKKHTLLVGAEKEGEGYYAISSELPETVFLLRTEDPIRSLRERGETYFRKSD